MKSHLKDATSQYSAGALAVSRGTMFSDDVAYTVEDGNYISGRWPGDAYKIGKEFISKILQ